MSQKNSRPKTSFVEFWFELLPFGPPVQCFPLEKFSECIQFFYSIAFLCQLLSDTRHLSNAVIKYTSYYNLSFFSFHVFIRREITNPPIFSQLIIFHFRRHCNVLVHPKFFFLRKFDRQLFVVSAPILRATNRGN